MPSAFCRGDTRQHHSTAIFIVWVYLSWNRSSRNQKIIRSLEDVVSSPVSFDLAYEIKIVKKRRYFHRCTSCLPYSSGTRKICATRLPRAVTITHSFPYWTRFNISPSLDRSLLTLISEYALSGRIKIPACTCFFEKRIAFCFFIHLNYTLRAICTIGRVCNNLFKRRLD